MINAAMITYMNNAISVVNSNRLSHNNHNGTWVMHGLSCVSLCRSGRTMVWVSLLLRSEARLARSPNVLSFIVWVSFCWGRRLDWRDRRTCFLKCIIEVICGSGSFGFVHRGLETVHASCWARGLCENLGKLSFRYSDIPFTRHLSFDTLPAQRISPPL